MRARARVRAPMCGLGLEPGVFLLLAVAVRDRLESPWTPRGRGLAVFIGLPAASLPPLLPHSLDPSLPLSAHQVPRLPSFFNRCSTDDINSSTPPVYQTCVCARVCSLSVHRLDGGLPQTGPADSAGTQEHRHPAPDQLHQGDDRSGQRVRRDGGGRKQDGTAGLHALKAEFMTIYLIFHGYKTRGHL